MTLSDAISVAIIVLAIAVGLWCLGCVHYEPPTMLG